MKICGCMDISIKGAVFHSPLVGGVNHPPNKNENIKSLATQGALFWGPLQLILILIISKCKKITHRFTGVRY